MEEDERHGVGAELGVLVDLVRAAARVEGQEKLVSHHERRGLLCRDAWFRRVAPSAVADPACLPEGNRAGTPGCIPTITHVPDVLAATRTEHLPLPDSFAVVGDAP
jgi:hypothetical protein